MIHYLLSGYFKGIIKIFTNYELPDTAAAYFKYINGWG